MHYRRHQVEISDLQALYCSGKVAVRKMENLKQVFQDIAGHKALGAESKLTYLRFVMRSSRAVIAQSVYRWATDWMIEVLGFDSQRWLGIFLFTTASRTALGLTQPPIQWVPGVLSLGVKRPRREADHSPPSSAEVKECVEL
jgi:hypothetical protein